MRAVQRDHAHHWNWPRREAVPFAPGCVGRAQRCYCGSTRYRNVRCESPVEPEADENSERPSTDLVVRRDIRRRLIARPRIAGGAGPFFWVGGTGTWDNATNTHWALTTGGAGGAGIPTAADNVTFDNSSGLTSNTTVTIAATAACNNLTIGSIAQASAAFTLSGNFTVSGTASVQGNAPTQRPIFNSSAVGTQRTLTLTTVSALANIDFMDIKGAGGLATFAGTSIGDAQGNATINFTASRTLYWVATSGGSWNVTTSWSLTTGGASGQNPPLPQDDVNFDSNSITSAGHTITVNLVRSGRNITVTLAWATTWTYSTNWSGYGSLDFFASVSGGASLITFTSASTQTLRGRGNHGFNPPHQGSPVFSQGWQFIAPGGTYTIDTDWETSVSAASAVGFSVVNGAIAFGGVAVHFTTTSLNLSGAAASIDFTNLFQIIITGTQNTSSGYVWNANAAASVTISFANIILSDASANNKTFIGGAHTYYTFNVTTATANGYIFTGANHYGVFTLTAGLVMFSVATHTFTNFIANNGAGGLLVQSQTGGSQATLAAEAGIGGFSWKGVTVQDITTSAALTIWVTSGVNTSNNGARVIFAAPSRSYAPTQSQSPTLIATDKRTFKPSGQSQTPTLKSTDKRTFVPTLSYFSQVLEEEPIAYWRLDESSGTTATDVQGTYPALYHGGFTLAQAGAVDGDDAVALDGTTGYLQVPVVAGLHPARFTYEAWIYPTVSSGVDKAIFASRASNRGILWWINGAVLSAYLYDGAAPHQFTNAAAIPVANAWYHVALTYDGAVATMYVNGVALTNTMAMATYVPQTATVLIIGRDAPSAEFYFPGTMDEAAVYNYALSAAEISNHYQAGLGNLTGQTQTSQAVANPNRTFKPTGQSQTVVFKEPLSRVFYPSQAPNLYPENEPIANYASDSNAGGIADVTSSVSPPFTQTLRTIQVKNNTAGTIGPDCYIGTGHESDWPNVTVGDTYTFSLYGQPGPGASPRSFHLTIEWYNGATHLSNVAGSNALEVAGSWVRATVSATAPATATHALLVVTFSSVPPAEIHYASAWMFTDTPDAVAYQGQAATPTLDVASDTRKFSATQSQTPTLTSADARTLKPTGQSQTGKLVSTDSRIFKPTQSQTTTMQASDARTFAPTQSQSVTLQGSDSRTFKVTQSQSTAIVRTATRLFKPTQSQSVATVRVVVRSIAPTQSQASTVQGSDARTFTPTQSQAPKLARTVTRALSSTQAQSVGMVRLASRILALAQTQTAVLVRAGSRTLAATQGQTPRLTAVIQRPLSLSQSASPALVRALARSLSASQAVRTTLGARQATRTLAPTQAQALAVRKAVSRALAATQGAAAGLTGGVGRSTALTQAQSAALSRALARSLRSSQSQSPGFVRALARVLARTQAQTTGLRGELIGEMTASQDQAPLVAGRVSIARSVSQASATALARTLVRASRVAQGAACYTVRCITGALAAGQGQDVGMIGVSPHDHYAGQGQAVVVLADPGRSFGGSQAAAASMGPPSVQRTMLATQAGVATLGSRYRSRALSATAPQSVVVIVVPRRSLMAHQSSAVGLRRGIARSRSLSQAGAIRITRNVRRTTHIAQSESAIVARSRRRTFTLGALQAPRISSTLSRSLRRGQAASVGVRRAVGRSYSLTQSQHAVRWIPPTAGILIVADSQGGGGVSSTSSGGFVRVTSPGLPVSATDGRISTEDGQGSIGVEGIDQVKTSVQATGILTVEAR